MLKNERKKYSKPDNYNNNKNNKNTYNLPITKKYCRTSGYKERS